MSERRHKHHEEEEIELSDENATYVLEPTRVEVGSGYTLSISHDENERPVVDVKTYGTVDLPKLRREIERMFPNAQIRKLDGTHIVSVVKRKNNAKSKTRKK
ncbi:hypothetical protein KEJ15_07900 [Candidatus Bathyarchaeota archaeon]|nr:hypothetical protein [Candidatus Bathyarchaeota archaeon]